MGFLGIVPATRLAAAYDPATEELTLYAEGKVIAYTSGIHFVQDQEATDGYRFTLYGWSGPILSPRQFREYQCADQFKLALPAGTASVTVVDAHSPEGAAVTVRYLGLNEAGPIPPDVPVATESDVRAKAEALNPKRAIQVAVGGTFTIGQPDAINVGGSIQVQTDASRVALVDAGIVWDGQPQIAWTFKALQPGQTEVKVIVSGGVATFVLQIPYAVTIG
ncbi:MAG TPA: hypothetical protein VGK74_09790 [Symbiobacteriaceae bacterium]|jgi:hypothetical protein